MRRRAQHQAWLTWRQERAPSVTLRRVMTLTRSHRHGSKRIGWCTTPTGAPATGAPAGDPPAAPAAPEGQDPDAFAARIRRTAERDAETRTRNALAAKLGIPPDQLDAHLDQVKKDADAKLEEGERHRRAAEQAQSAQQAADAKAAAAEQRAALTTKLFVAGLPAGKPADLRDALRLLDIPDGADEAAMDAAIVELKTRRAELFAGTPAAPVGFQMPSPGNPPNPTQGRQPQGTANPASPWDDPVTRAALESQGLKRPSAG